MTFLNDVFEKLNLLNISMQGSDENILTLSGKLQGFKDKLQLWTVKIANRKLDCFPGLDLLDEKMVIYSDVIELLKNLTAAFNQYFPNLDVCKDLWVVNPFVASETNLNATLEENLIDIRNDVSLKVLFREKETSEFWISIYEQYPQLAQKAVEILLPFGSSYLCELGFSALTQIKTKTRSRMVDIDKEMRVALSKVQPRLELICSERQAHPSH